MTNKFVLGVSTLFLSCSALAATTYKDPGYKDAGALTDPMSNIVFSVAVGPNWAYTNNSTHLVVSPIETDSIVKSNIANHPIWKVGMGYHIYPGNLQQGNLFRDVLVELNLYQSSETVKGNVWQFQLPQFNNFIYSAPITSTRLMLDVKPSLYSMWNTTIYPIVGMGVTWNNIAYNETVTGAGVPAGSNYILGSTDNANFAFDVGAGIHTDFTTHLGASVEYLYSNLGNMTPSNTSKNGNPIVSAPTFSIRNQSVLFGLSYKV